MLNTITLVQQYSEFCKLGTLPVKPTADGFIKLMCGSFMMPVFIAFVNQQGYSMEQIEEWEHETFNEGDPDRFFEEVEAAFKQLEG